MHWQPLRYSVSLPQISQQKIGSNTKLQLTKAQKIAVLKKDISERNGQLQKQARSAQVNNSGSVLKFISDSESFSDAVSRTITVATVVRANNQTMKQQEDDKSEVEAQQTALNKSIKKDKTLQIELMRSSADLDAKRAELNAKKNKEDTVAQKAAADAKKAADDAEKAKTIAAATKAADTAKDSVGNKDQGQQATEPASTQTVQLASNNNNAKRNNSAGSNGGGGSFTPAPAASYGSVTAYALSFVDKSPYVWGGTTPAGFNCSGFVQYVFIKKGKSLPRMTTAQENAGTQIPIGQAQPGDLYFWGGRGSSYHVAIALGGGDFVHAPAPGQKVSVSNTSYYTPSFAVRLR